MILNELLTHNNCANPLPSLEADVQLLNQLGVMFIVMAIMKNCFGIIGGMGTMATEDFVHTVNRLTVTHRDQ
ncbi:hypothetical protein WP50_19155, partial [Lactiplantibacillus plantarum]